MPYRRKRHGKKVWPRPFNARSFSLHACASSSSAAQCRTVCPCANVRAPGHCRATEAGTEAGTEQKRAPLTFPLWPRPSSLHPPTNPPIHPLAPLRSLAGGRRERGAGRGGAEGETAARGISLPVPSPPCLKAEHRKIKCHKPPFQSKVYCTGAGMYLISRQQSLSLP
eukprot:1802116-Rhodomonas_salina.2